VLLLLVHQAPRVHPVPSSGYRLILQLLVHQEPRVYPVPRLRRRLVLLLLVQGPGRGRRRGARR